VRPILLVALAASSVAYLWFGTTSGDASTQVVQPASRQPSGVAAGVPMESPERSVDRLHSDHQALPRDLRLKALTVLPPRDPFGGAPQDSTLGQDRPVAPPSALAEPVAAPPMPVQPPSPPPPPPMDWRVSGQFLGPDGMVRVFLSKPDQSMVLASPGVDLGQGYVVHAVSSTAVEVAHAAAPAVSLPLQPLKAGASQ